MDLNNWRGDGQNLRDKQNFPALHDWKSGRNNPPLHHNPPPPPHYHQQYNQAHQPHQDLQKSSNNAGRVPKQGGGKKKKGKKNGTPKPPNPPKPPEKPSQNLSGQKRPREEAAIDLEAQDLLRLRGEVASFRSEISSLRSLVQQQRTILSKRDMELLVANNASLQDQRGEVASFRSEISSLRSLVHQQRTILSKRDMELLMANNASLQDQISVLVEDKESYEFSVNDHMRFLTDINSSLRKDIKKFKNEIAELAERNLNLEGKVTRLEKPMKEAALAHLALCVERRDEAELKLKVFCSQYTTNAIHTNPQLKSRYNELSKIKDEAWNAFFLALKYAYPPTLEDVLWCVAKAGFIDEVAPLINLSKATRNCKNLKPIMMNIKRGGINGVTQLLHCARHGSVASVERLLSIRNIDVNVKNAQGQNALHFAALRGNLEMTQMLISAGADVNAVANDETISILGVNGARTPLLHAVKNGNIQVVQLLLRNGAKYFLSPIHLWLAAVEGHVSILHLLVENGIDPDDQIRSGFEIGSRALHLAATFGHKQFVSDLVIRYRVNINSRDAFGRTARELSLSYPEITSFLKDFGGTF